MELLKDMHRLGPAPTWEREMAAAAANLVFLLVVVGVLAFGMGSGFVAAVLVVAGTVYTAGRLAVAARRRRTEASR